MAAPPGEEADHAAAGEEHDEQQQDAEQELPVLGDLAELVLEQDVERGAGHRPAEPADAAEDDETISSPDRCQDSIVGLTKRLRSA